MDKALMLKAFAGLDRVLSSPVRLIVGGGAAMIAAYGIPVSTLDVDAVPDKGSLDLAVFKKRVAEVGRALGISEVWLNDYFSAFLFVLPSDYGSRLTTLFKGKNLEACALGREDLILMKCFAAREKDIPHVRALIRQGVDLKRIDQRIEELKSKSIGGADRAADFFDDICDALGVGP